MYNNFYMKCLFLSFYLYCVESLKDAGGNHSEETLYRHSQLPGRMRKVIDKAYLPESARDFIKHTSVSMTKDLQLFVKLLHTERFFVKSPGRSFKTYPDFHFSLASKFPQKFKQKIVQLSKRLDKIRGTGMMYSFVWNRHDLYFGVWCWHDLW